MEIGTAPVQKVKSSQSCDGAPECCTFHLGGAGLPPGEAEAGPGGWAGRRSQCSRTHLSFDIAEMIVGSATPAFQGDRGVQTRSWL